MGINLSGRQRMLPAHRQGHPVGGCRTRQGVAAGPELDELAAAVRLFDDTQRLPERRHRARRRRQTGLVTAGRGPRAADILAKAQALWTPYQQLVALVLSGSATDAELQAAVDYARTNNPGCWA